MRNNFFYLQMNLIDRPHWSAIKQEFATLKLTHIGLFLSRYDGSASIQEEILKDEWSLSAYVWDEAKKSGVIIKVRHPCYEWASRFFQKDLIKRQPEAIKTATNALKIPTEKVAEVIKRNTPYNSVYKYSLMRRMRKKPLSLFFDTSREDGHIEVRVKLMSEFPLTFGRKAKLEHGEMMAQTISRGRDANEASELASKEMFEQRYGQITLHEINAANNYNFRKTNSSN